MIPPICIKILFSAIKTILSFPILVLGIYIFPAGSNLLHGLCEFKKQRYSWKKTDSDIHAESTKADIMLNAESFFSMLFVCLLSVGLLYGIFYIENRFFR